MTIAEMLRRAFIDVQEFPDGKVLARGHTRFPTATTCKHERRLRAELIWACISPEGYLVSGDSPVKYRQVISCQRCEKVLAHEVLRRKNQH